MPLAIGSVVNGIYGIPARGNSSLFVRDAHYIFRQLSHPGLGQPDRRDPRTGRGLSIFHGGPFGRSFAIFVGALVAIGALLEIPARPFWSVAVFALTLSIIWRLTTTTKPEPGS